jgi:restriction system protein
MSLSDFLKTQQNLQDSLFPPSIKNLLETQRRANDTLYPAVVRDFLENQENWKAIFDSNPLKDIKPIVDLPGIHNYWKTFKAIEKVNMHFAIAESISSKLEYSYANYDLLEFVDNTPEEEIKEIETVIVDQTKSIKRIITDIYQDNTNLLKIEPRQFEEMIAELLYSKGFKVELTKQTRDNGYDIIALKILENNFPLKFLVECKRFKKDKVGVDIIRSFKEVMQTQNANKGIIVTTSYFTKDANKKRLETPYLLDYKDKDDVLLWVTEYCDR